ncbi:uncharacterized protein LOC121078498 [Cygnus olor]|uniref:uncharacterized protein LOC121078498 n=1 Tax=Cygnus olor TaxID=8869 RepID=UPI001ADE59E2|nr:uncharacterized protein LOC121078498 [Cygnus olor]
MRDRAGSQRQHHAAVPRNHWEPPKSVPGRGSGAGRALPAQPGGHWDPGWVLAAVVAGVCSRLKPISNGSLWNIPLIKASYPTCQRSFIKKLYSAPYRLCICKWRDTQSLIETSWGRSAPGPVGIPNLAGKPQRGQRGARGAPGDASLPPPCPAAPCPCGERVGATEIFRAWEMSGASGRGEGVSALPAGCRDRMRGVPASPRAFNQRRLTPDGCTIGRLANGSVPKRGSQRPRLPGGFHPALAQQRDGAGMAAGPQLASCSPWPRSSQDGATAGGWQRCHRRTALLLPAVPGHEARPRGATSQRLWILRVLRTAPCLAQGKTQLILLPDFIGTLPCYLPGGGPGRSPSPAYSFLCEDSLYLRGLNLPSNIQFFKAGLGCSGIWEKLEQGAGKL